MDDQRENKQSQNKLDFSLLKKLLAFLVPYKKYVFIALGLTFITTAINPLRPYLVKVAIDDYLAIDDFNGLFEIVIIIFSLLIIGAILQFSMGYLMQWVGQKVLLDIRLKVFNHINSLPISQYDKNPVGRFVTRVTNDIEALNELFSTGVVMLIADILLIAWIVGFMFYTNVTLALLTLAILPFLIIASLIFRLKVREIFGKIRNNIASINSFINEFISGISTVKLFNREKELNEKFDELNKSNAGLWLKTIHYHAIFFPVVEMFSAIAIAIVLWYTAGNILEQIMTIGVLIAFLQYSEMFFRPVRDLTEKYATLQSALAASERVFSILELKPDELLEKNFKTQFSGLKEQIEFENIAFSYDGEKEVLKEINFIVKKGETVALVGATGAGKSTIINLLCGFYLANQGNIYIDKMKLADYDIHSLRERIALVMQDVFLFSRSLKDNISLGKENIGNEQIKQAIISLGAGQFIERYGFDLSKQILEKGANLSAGERQLVSFARAYVCNPDILILDEATSSIDSETEIILQKSLQKLLEGRTSIIIAHRLSTIEKADKILVLHKGNIAEMGTHHELSEQGGIYSKLYKLQFEEA